jgi:hypothetical protein
MAAPTFPNHRRDRQQVRRVLAEIVVRGRDLTGSNFLRELDLLDGQRHAPANDNRADTPVAADGVKR